MTDDGSSKPIHDESSEARVLIQRGLIYDLLGMGMSVALYSSTRFVDFKASKLSRPLVQRLTALLF